jgi:hypothetical protein
MTRDFDERQAAKRSCEPVLRPNDQGQAWHARSNVLTWCVYTSTSVYAGHCVRCPGGSVGGITICAHWVPESPAGGGRAGGPKARIPLLCEGTVRSAYMEKAHYQALDGGKSAASYGRVGGRRAAVRSSPGTRAYRFRREHGVDTLQARAS